ncbi:unnamed protein product [Lathyrus sativus]|nr:unnamed protein product [Lathyrus sativus]
MAEQQEYRNVAPRIWQECAGSSFTVPKLHSKVYYFPFGHLEHSPVTPTAQTLSLLRPFILCTVSCVDFLAHSETDQICAKLLLTPVVLPVEATNEGDDHVVLPVEATNEGDDHVVLPVEATNEGDDHVVSCAKTLSNSDANNGGAFSVPRACAKSIFPPLDLTTPLPSQELSVTDVCGVVWTFRHVYRGNPKRFLFTTGWSAFVDKKQLVCGDTLVFIKNSAVNIFVGIRRKNMFAAANKIAEKTVINAIELAGKNTPFEVVCYPRVDDSDFVVGDKVVEDAMKIHWYPGMRVTRTVKNENSSKGCTTLHGTISAISHSSTNPWRMLLVEWNEFDISEKLKHVSPWQVEPDFSIPQELQLFAPIKRLRTARESTLLTDKERVVSPISMEPLHQTPLNFDFRQNPLKDTSLDKSSMEGSNNVSIQLSITNHKSHDHNIFNSSGIRNSNTEEVRPDYIKLFGQIVRPSKNSIDFYEKLMVVRSENEVEDPVKSVEKK